MQVVDAAGRSVEDACADLVITRVAAVAAGAPCTSTIAVKVEDGDGIRAINMLEPLLRKGETLPRQGVKSLRAARRLDPGSPEWIDVELFEKAEGVEEPEANLLIGSFRLSGEDLPAYAAPLKPGEQVVLHWSVDDSQLIRCSIELPEQGLHLRDHSFYADDLARIDFARNGRDYATQALISTDRRLDDLEEVEGAQGGDRSRALRRRIAEQFARLLIVDDADGFRSIAEEARLIRQEISRLRHRPELRVAALRAELNRVEAGSRELTALLSAEHRAQLAQQHAAALAALADGRLNVAERSIEAMEKIIFSVLAEQPDYVLGHYRHLRNQRHAATDPVRFDLLARRGDTAAESRNIAEIRSVIREMAAIMAFASEPASDVAALAGLRR